MKPSSTSRWHKISSSVFPSHHESPAYLAGHFNYTPRRKVVLETLDLFEKVTIKGKITDSLGLPVAGAMVEIWHPTKWGLYGMEFGPSSAPVDATEQGWMHCTTDNSGYYSFLTEKRTDLSIGKPASLHFKVTTANGYVKLTKLYFGHEQHELADDPFLYDLDPAERSEYFGWESQGICEFDIAC